MRLYELHNRMTELDLLTDVKLYVNRHNIFDGYKKYYALTAYYDCYVESFHTRKGKFVIYLNEECHDGDCTLIDYVLCNNDIKLNETLNIYKDGLKYKKTVKDLILANSEFCKEKNYWINGNDILIDNRLPIL